MQDSGSIMVKFRGREIRRILIRSVNWIGDAVLTTPAISSLRRNFPEAKISILAKPWVSEIFKGNPDIDDVILYEESGLGYRLRLIGDIRRRGFDMAVLFQNAFEAALIAFLSGIPIRLGYSTDGRGILLRPSITVRAETKKKHHLEYYLDLLRDAGLSVEGISPVLNLDEVERAWAIDFLKRNGWDEGKRLIGINPGATYGRAKRWYPERFAFLIDRLMGEGLTAIIFSGPGENPIVEEIKNRVGSKPILSVEGVSVRELSSLIERCSIFISNDTGPMHLASALQVPVVAIFGSTDPNMTGPVGERQRIIYKNVECSPCFLRECPKDFRCMDLITVDEVFYAVKEILNR